MKRWITEERVTELERMGRLRDNVTKNGHKDTSGLGNVEFVTVTSGGVNPDSRGGSKPTSDADLLARRVNPTPLTHIDAVGGASCKATVSTVQCREGGAVNQPARSAPILAQRGGMVTSSAASITLPWPPSGNTAVRHAKGVHYLRPEVTTYRQAVAVILGRSEPVVGRYELVIELSPPDARRRDIDNALKSLLDACVKCGWLPDDSMAYMRRLTVTVKDDRRGEVSIYALTDREAA